MSARRSTPTAAPSPQHRAVRAPARRPAAHRIRPRYGRIGAVLTAFAVTLVALLAGIGVLPVQPRQPAAAEGSLTGSGSGHGDATGTPSGLDASHPEAREESATVLPTQSGSGRRVVFDISDQRVWLVGGDGQVRSSYLVSGSLTDNLAPGQYSVYSRSRWAVGVDESGVMQYMVRFAHGKHAPIGFHSIPTKHGRELQTRAQLGSPQSHGCIRQWKPDALRLWRFAPIGTKVVVTA